MKPINNLSVGIIVDLGSKLAMSGLDLPAFAAEPTGTMPGGSSCCTSTCSVFSKIWHKTRSIVTLQCPVRTPSRLNPSVSTLYILCLFLTHISYVSSTCSVRLAVQTIRYQNCIPQRVLNNVCGGRCQSYSETDPNDPTYIQHSCNCCKIENSSIKRLHMRCPSPNGERRYIQRVFQVRFIHSCSCRPCSQLPDIQTGEFL